MTRYPLLVLVVVALVWGALIIVPFIQHALDGASGGLK